MKRSMLTLQHYGGFAITWTPDALSNIAPDLADNFAFESRHDATLQIMTTTGKHWRDDELPTRVAISEVARAL